PGRIGAVQHRASLDGNALEARDGQDRPPPRRGDRRVDGCFLASEHPLVQASCLRETIKRLARLSSLVLVLLSSQALAESCLNDNKQGGAGDARHYDYVACKPSGVAGGQSYNSVGIIGGQMADIMSRRPQDSGYSDEERAANRRALHCSHDSLHADLRDRNVIPITASIFVNEYGYHLAC
ncbi:MAG TPA: hypothetical protein VGE22_13815, partial [Solimonas sp.]